MNQSDISQFIINVAKDTPLYVWIILVYLLITGIKATKKHIVYLPKMFIIPTILLGLKYKIFFTNDILQIIGYCFFMTLGLGMGYFFNYKMPIKILKDTNSVELPGSYRLLVILILFFVIKYVLGYLQATDQMRRLDYFIYENLISALFSGYFLGAAVSYLYRFLKDKKS